jgi:hypothetical protein
MDLRRALETYTVLTIGDGLITQLPALLVSTAAGILVTRAAGADLGSQLFGQLFGKSRVLLYSSLPGGGADPYDEPKYLRALQQAGSALAATRKGQPGEQLSKTP